MNDFFWHIDEGFFSLVEKPLFILGAVFVVMLVITAVFVIRSTGGSDDS